MKLLIFILLLLSCNELYATNVYSCKDKQVELIVRRLVEENDKIRDDLRMLSEKPFEAVSCLIKELSIVQEEKILLQEYDQHKETLHVIWCIRALRYLTGIDFRGKTAYQFKESEKNREDFLNKNSKTELPFFAVWMSRGSIYIAPKDTQEEIINKWKEWYSINGKSFKYDPVDDINKWYF
jgi:hypothetical protein